MKSPREEQVYDAIVVGAGAAGGWAAKELCERGLDVLLLDAGRTLDARADFPLPPPPEARRRARLTALLGGQRIQARCEAFNAKTRHFFVDDRENPYLTPPDAPFNWFRSRQVGGRLCIWGRVAIRLSDYELKAATRDGYGVDWPLSYAELAPCYDTVEQFFGLHGDVDGLAGLPDGRYIGRAAELTPREKAFKQTVATDFSDRRVIGARLAGPEPHGLPRTILAAQATERLVLRPDSVARSVSIDPATGKATGVSFTDRRTKAPGDARARVVVLCAGTLETLRIMLNSTSSRHPRGLGNSSGRLGCYLMDHVLSSIAGPMPDGHPQEPADPYDFAGVGFLIPRFRNLESAHPAFLRGYGIQGGIGRRGPGWSLAGHGEMLPRSTNRVTLDPRRKDAWGAPVPHITCAFSANETAMALDQFDVMRELAAAAGLEPGKSSVDRLALRLWRHRLYASSGAFLPGSAIHVLGGAGMGDDPDRFVLNRFGQCWDAENVFVTDGASFPSGCWQSTTLTIMALTVRACEHIDREYRAGRV